MRWWGRAVDGVQQLAQRVTPILGRELLRGRGSARCLGRTLRRAATVAKVHCAPAFMADDHGGA
eukprot:2615964-Alexandrium_andersonii.AAC.1